MKNKTGTLCSVPWKQLATNSSGHFRVCCNALPGKNLVHDELGNVLSLPSSTVDSIWNAPTYLRIREEMLKGLRPDMCQRCFREEDAGVESARQKWNKKWPEEKLPKTLHVDIESIEYLDLRLGNLCNLKCRMCNPYSSSKWVSEWNLLETHNGFVPNQKLSSGELSRLQKMNWPDKEETWINLEPIMQTVDEIYLTGGEPFLSLKHFELLEKLIAIGRADQVIVKYNTNATVFPEPVRYLWPKFKEIRLNLSIDGIGSFNDYIRFPAKWDIVQENLNRFFEMKRTGFPLDIRIHTTVQIYNIMQISKITNFFRDTYGVMPYFNILNHPAPLNIRSLPIALKTAAAEELSSLSHEGGIREIVSYMMAEDWSAEYWHEFQKYTLQLDSIRNQRFSDLDNKINISSFFESDNLC